MKMELIEGSETSAYDRRRGDTQKNTYMISLFPSWSG